MSSNGARRVLAAAALAVGLSVALSGAHGGRSAPRFFPDDPLLVDRDTVMDASGAAEVELSETYDFLENSFSVPGDRTPIRALNVNTIDEVPDSSWFTNRIRIREMALEEIARGPNKFPRLDVRDWVVIRSKGPGGFQPGFRAVHADDPEQVYQLEVDPRHHPQMATGAELVGTLIYHAVGYHVPDVYMLRVDPGRIRIDDSATLRDASGQRRFTRADLDAILRNAARDADGRVYMSAVRFEEGKDLGEFKYYARRVLDWARHYGDRDGDGYLEYKTLSPQAPGTRAGRTANTRSSTRTAPKAIRRSPPVSCRGTSCSTARAIRALRRRIRRALFEVMFKAPLPC